MGCSVRRQPGLRGGATRARGRLYFRNFEGHKAVCEEEKTKQRKTPKRDY